MELSVKFSLYGMWGFVGLSVLSVFKLLLDSLVISLTKPLLDKG